MADVEESPVPRDGDDSPRKFWLNVLNGVVVAAILGAGGIAIAVWKDGLKVSYGHTKTETVGDEWKRDFAENFPDGAWYKICASDAQKFAEVAVYTSQKDFNEKQNARVISMGKQGQNTWSINPPAVKAVAVVPRGWHANVEFHVAVARETWWQRWIPDRLLDTNIPCPQTRG